MESNIRYQAAIIRDDHILLLKVWDHTCSGEVFWVIPGGGRNHGESEEDCVIREVLEETGCTVECENMIGVYLWIHPQTRQQFLRIVYAAKYISCDESLALDDGILGRRWMSLGDLRDRRSVLRTPAVLRCVEDYVSGRRESDALLTGMLPLQHNVHRILATADLV